MTIRADLAENYMPAAQAGIELGENTTWIYGRVQKGVLDGFREEVSGRWWVTKESVKRLKRARELTKSPSKLNHHAAVVGA
ncbi:MAG: hypothetical protein JWM41_2175 [Gemmatimonadetes bacterium]|nr:hypothetical protein [Gemmatimonadota bacterium]